MLNLIIAAVCVLTAVNAQLPGASPMGALQAQCTHGVMTGGVTDRLSDTMGTAALQSLTQLAMAGPATPTALGAVGGNNIGWQCLMQRSAVVDPVTGQINAGATAGTISDYFDTVVEIKRFIPMFNPCETVFCGERGISPLTIASNIIQSLSMRRPLQNQFAHYFNQQSLPFGTVSQPKNPMGMMTGGFGNTLGGAFGRMGMHTVGMGGATPSFGGAVPTMGGATPTLGGAVPTLGGATPTLGGAVPTMGGATGQNPIIAGGLPVNPFMNMMNMLRMGQQQPQPQPQPQPHQPQPPQPQPTPTLTGSYPSVAQPSTGTNPSPTGSAGTDKTVTGLTKAPASATNHQPSTPSSPSLGAATSLMGRLAAMRNMFQPNPPPASVPANTSQPPNFLQRLQGMMGAGSGSGPTGGTPTMGIPGMGMPTMGMPGMGMSGMGMPGMGMSGMGMPGMGMPGMGMSGMGGMGNLMGAMMMGEMMADAPDMPAMGAGRGMGMSGGGMRGLGGMMSGMGMPGMGMPGMGMSGMGMPGMSMPGMGMSGTGNPFAQFASALGMGGAAAGSGSPTSPGGQQIPAQSTNTGGGLPNLAGMYRMFQG